MSENEIMVHQATVLEPQQVKKLSIADVKAACNYVKQLLDEVMKEDVHFGTIPGCGKKRALFKAGADKIKQALNLYPEFEGWDSPIDLGGGHVAYRIKTTMRTVVGDYPVATGIGYCSSMEKKYRYTVGELKPTGNPVPADYWTFRKTEPAKAQKLIGGEGFRVKKITPQDGSAGRWEICIAGEPMERPDIEDVHNTVLKMSKKRSYVDCAITAASASDLLEQDTIDETDMTIEDGAVDGGGGHGASKNGAKGGVKPAQSTDDKQVGNGEQSGNQQQPMGQAKKDLFEKIRALCRGNQEEMAKHLKRLTTYESKKTGKKSDGKTNIDMVSDMEATIALKKLNQELEVDEGPGRE